MNPELGKLQPYPFEKLNRLVSDAAAPEELAPISLAIGEPGHTTPAFIAEALMTHLHGLANYPTTRGGLRLRQAIASWLGSRFSLPAGSVDADKHVLPVNGTREALFAFAQCVVDRSRDAVVMMPNPFYQIYEGAALLAGATPWYVNCSARTGFVPDIDAVPQHVWQKCQLMYLCSPGNPTGAVMDGAMLERLIGYADKYDFVIAADECYSEIYAEEDRPPPGLLQIAAELGRLDFRRCIVFNSLSKRSSVPGLRSGFVAGDAAIIARFLLYRTYHGCAMPPQTQAASVAAWEDEEHVRQNRELYRTKLHAVRKRLSTVWDVKMPDGGFYYWPETPLDDEVFARDLLRQTNVKVLPGRYLSRDTPGGNPGIERVRLAMVPPLPDCLEAADRICDFVSTLPRRSVSV